MPESFKYLTNWCSVKIFNITLGLFNMPSSLGTQ